MPTVISPKTLELLAPAGNLESGYAAFHYGADAVYLGLKKFSARADADNFSLAELSAFTAFAHSLAPRRKVYLTLNTLIQQREIAEFRRVLELLPLTRIDAVIAQDFGALYLLRRDLPDLPIHASTQMTAHNVATARKLADFGVKRITLARELTLAEIREISAALLPLATETEFFLHGALCYAYSGLCLFSSHLTGRSANRGRCCYPCRGKFTFAPRESGETDGFANANCSQAPASRAGYFFSMKDLSLAESLAALRAAGVSSLKIEGRKKSALYVAAAVDFYRRLLDDKIPAEKIGDARRDLQSVFSRELCAEFIGDDTRGSLIDPDFVGHRGAPIGKIEKIAKRGDAVFLLFKSAADLEIHDGLQFAVAGYERPYGFAITELFAVDSRWRPVFAASGESSVAVKIPADAPRLAVGAKIYHGSSQTAKRRYPLPRPRANAQRNEWRIEITVKFSAAAIFATAKFSPPLKNLPAPQPANLRQNAAALIDFMPPPFNARIAEAKVAGEFSPAQKSQAATIRQAFAKTAEFPFALETLEIINPENLFAPVSKLNQLRRELYAKLGEDLQVLIISTDRGDDPAIARKS